MIYPRTDSKILTEGIKSDYGIIFTLGDAAVRSKTKGTDCQEFVTSWNQHRTIRSLQNGDNA